MGKTWPTHSFLPLPPSSYQMFYPFYLSFNLLDNTNLLCILTLMNCLFQRENQVCKPNSLLVLLRLGGGEGGKTRLAHSSLTPSKMFLSSSIPFRLSAYVTLWLYLNKFEWPIPKRVSSFQTNKFIGTSSMWVGKDWAGTFFPPPKCFDFSIYLSVFWIMYLNSFDVYQAENKVFLVLLHCGVRNDWASLQNVPICLFYLSSFRLCYSYMNTYEWPISMYY